jgi:WhiB family redox-sensing transcriptional regulator
VKEPDWSAGLCAQTDPDLFFPEKGASSAAAISICRRCPIRAECLEFAIDEPGFHGVWGGTTQKQRQMLRRDRDRSRKWW